MYLNKIYFGQEGARGIYGVEEAAGFYFSKRAADLTLEEVRDAGRRHPLAEPVLPVPRPGGR